MVDDPEGMKVEEMMEEMADVPERMRKNGLMLKRGTYERNGRVNEKTEGTRMGKLSFALSLSLSLTLSLSPFQNFFAN